MPTAAATATPVGRVSPARVHSTPAQTHRRVTAAYMVQAASAVNTSSE